jgi:hypothetical protein
MDNQVARRGNERQIGTPIRMQSTLVMKAPGSGVKAVKRDEGYGWEEEEGKGNWILEKLASRFCVCEMHADDPVRKVEIS